MAAGSWLSMLCWRDSTAGRYTSEESRGVADVLGMGVVPPCGLVVRHAVDDAVAHDGGSQGRHDQALQVIKAQPGGQHAAVFGLGIRGANAQAHRLDSPTVPVQLGQVFAKGFGQAIKAIGLGGHAGVDHFVLAVKAGHVVGAGKHDALDALQACGFIQVDHAHDVASQNWLPRLFC